MTRLLVMLHYKRLTLWSHELTWNFNTGFVVKPLAKLDLESRTRFSSGHTDYALLRPVTDNRDYYQCSDHVIFGLKLATLKICCVVVTWDAFYFYQLRKLLNINPAISSSHITCALQWASSVLNSAYWYLVL